MEEVKKEFRWFSITEYEKEAEYLRRRMWFISLITTRMVKRIRKNTSRCLRTADGNI